MTENEQRLSHYTDLIAHVKKGDIIDGIILEIGKEFALIDLSYKTEGTLVSSELERPYAVGDAIRVVVLGQHAETGAVVVSRKRILRDEAKQTLLNAYHAKTLLKGVVTKALTHGYEVQLTPLSFTAFLPYSQADVHKIYNANTLINRDVEVQIVKCAETRDTLDIVVSRKEPMLKKITEACNLFCERYTENDRITAAVVEIARYGIRVDAEGVPGFIDINELSWLNSINPHELLKIGQRIECKILAIDGEKYKITLSVKQLSDDPWNTIENYLTNHEKVTGIIEAVKPFGIFVRLHDAYQGLVHNSEIAWDNNGQNTKSAYRVGQTVAVKILEINPAERRLLLSIKQTTTSDWEKRANKYINSVIHGSIKKVTDAGLVIRLPESLEGFIHIDQLHWGNVPYSKSDYVVDSDIETKVHTINPLKKQILLSRKKLLNNPWNTLKKYKAEKTVIAVEVVEKTENGVKVKIFDNINAFIHSTALANPLRRPQSTLLESIPLHEKIEVLVTEVNPKTKKVLLSSKLVDTIVMKSERKKYLIADNEQEQTMIGDLTRESR